MRKGEMNHKLEEDNIRQFLQRSAEEETIPESLQPARMEEWLRQQCDNGKEEPMGIKNKESEQEMANNGKKARKHIGWWCTTFAAAACLALVLFMAGKYVGLNNGGDTAPDTSALDMAADGGAADMESDMPADEVADDKSDASARSGADGFEEGTTYAKLYSSFDKYWTEQEELYRESFLESTTDAAVDDAADAAASEDAAGGMEYAEDAAAAAFDKESADVSDMEAGGSVDSSAEETADEEDYGKTNQQEETVEEADIIKNDGRYLYRVADKKNGSGSMVRIIDTQGGLKEVAQVGNFEYVQDMYIWKDKLAVIEPGWAVGTDTDKAAATEDIIGEPGYSYSRIYVYDISDRANPQEYHTFTVKGSYMSSRISDGYLYFFASCNTQRPEKEEDLRAYVPMLDGEPLAEDKIALPEESKAASYLVMASVDMEQPDKFTDTRALVTSADRFYVSPNNIYVAETQYISYEEEGHKSDSTILYRYSYKDGKMRKEAKGTVKGTLRDDMAMNEYRGYLRLVTTVESQSITKIIDDISGEFLGYDDMDAQTTNSLYVLDEDLTAVGKVEDLAKDERVYSARFMGNTGYFVTFRETDPLFSVDLSNPREPKILGELKISGFSEYLHFYADNLLLGIGMEADENTGITDCLKLSMFDISNPADVKEKSKMKLIEYDYSEALYNYKAVLIDVKKNLFGFTAEDFDENKFVYLLFKFENGEFCKVMEIDCSDFERYSYGIRGTYIGERFFLLADNGLVEEYSLKDGRKTAVLEP